MTRILITGANRGIGAAMAADADARGWDVIRATRPGQGGDLTFDVTDHAAINAAAVTLDGPMDILMNNAGIIGPARQATLDMDFEAFLPHLQRSDQARILTISSQMSAMGSTVSDRIAYRASKAAVNKVMQGLATDLEDEKIAVALINPGWVRTDMGGASADLSPHLVAKGVLDVAAGLTMAQTGGFYKWSGEAFAF